MKYKFLMALPFLFTGAIFAMNNKQDLFLDYKISGADNLLDAIAFNIDREKISQATEQPNLVPVAVRLAQYMRDNNLSFSELVDEIGWNPLHQAAYMMDFDAVFVILYAAHPHVPTLLNERTFEKNSVLHLVVNAKHGTPSEKIRMVEYLLSTLTHAHKHPIVLGENRMGESPTQLARRLDQLHVSLYLGSLGIELQKYSIASWILRNVENIPPKHGNTKKPPMQN